MLLIRHGQSEFNAVFNVTRVDPGIRDPRLTEEGRSQARLAAGRLAGEGLKRLVASPYTRAIETASIIGQALGISITIDPRVGERAAFACDVGTPASVLRTTWPHLALDHLVDTWWPEAEESEAALALRCEGFRHDIARQPDWASIGVVTHWGFIRGFAGIPVPNGAVLRVDPGRPDRPPVTLVGAVAAARPNAPEKP